MEVNQKSKSYQARRVSPCARNTTQSQWNSFSLEMFSLVTGLEELPELRVEQSSLYAHQNRRNFTIAKEKLKALLGINFVITINRLPMIAECWRVNNLISNDGI